MASKKKAAPKKAAARKAAPKKKAAKKRPPPAPPPVEATVDKHAGGRPTKYLPQFDAVAYKMCLMGATDADLAEALCVNEDTINEWKKVHESFAKALSGKRIANAETAYSLYQRANGYEHDAVQFFNHNGNIIEARYTKRYPPDTAAASLWLRNREPDLWRDKIDHEHAGRGGGAIPIAAVTANLDELTDEEAAKAYLDFIRRGR